MKIKKEKFEVHAYVDAHYKHLLEEYEETYGINGLDHLWTLESSEEVDHAFDDCRWQRIMKGLVA
jgi:hypothetical protein